MRQERAIMGMPISVEIDGPDVGQKDFDEVFDFFIYVDEKFSTYKSTSETSKINQGLIKESEYSDDMKEIIRLSNETARATNGFFTTVAKDLSFDPLGLVKGWAINKASELLEKRGLKNYYIEAGGDIQTKGENAEGENWSVGIRNPFNRDEIIKVVYLSGQGIATSGTYARGQHITNPLKPNLPILEIVSLTVVGPNVYEADRFATAAFAMGKVGIDFIEKLEGFEGYMIDCLGIATYTSGFEKITSKIC
jgi:thiamine biosynthesis lipoprotein